VARLIQRGEVRWYRFRRPDKKRPVVILTRQSALDFLGEENDKGKKTRTLDLLIRLGVATLIAARHGKPLPDDLAPLVDQLEAAFDVGTHRLTHLDQALPEHQWEETPA
jgi:hypothetical protein